MSAQIFRIDPEGVREEIVLEVAAMLMRGRLVIYPTETFYALGAVPHLPAAVARVFEAKGRDSKKPLPLIASDRPAVMQAASAWPEDAEILARKFWPGPLTLVLPASPLLPSALHGGTGRIAIRISSHPVATMLAKAVGGLLISTSANRAGEVPPCSSAVVAGELMENVQAFLNTGDLPGGLPSTIIDVSVRPPKLLRAGKITWEEVRGMIGE